MGNKAMKNSPEQDNDLRRRSWQRLTVGVLASALLVPAGTLAATPGWPADITWLLGALVAGMAVRSLELRAFFGQRISLHQSASLQFILDFARWTSPLLPRRRLETELVARETSIDSEHVASWSSARQRWRPALLAALTAVSLAVFTDSPVATSCAVAAALIMTLAASWNLLVGLASGQRAAADTLARELAMLLVAVLALIVEALLLKSASGSLDPLAAAALFFSFGLVRAVPVTPYATGTLQLVLYMLCLANPAPAAVFLALVLQACWLALSAAPAMAYLPRYKLRVSDLFNAGLPAALARSRRPESGWAASNVWHRSPVLLTVVIPAYNERERLPAYLPQVIGFVRLMEEPANIIVVDDGSSDDTAGYVSAVAAAHPCVRLLQRPRNGGKGRAVLDGVEAADGRFVLIADADGATPIEEAETLLEKALAGHEIVIGSRAIGNKLRSREALRARLGRAFYALVNIMAVPGIGDTQCGFKLLRSDVARALFRELGEHGWAFDVEILYRAQLAGYAVAEVPVRWQEIAGSKIRPIRDGLRMLTSLVRIRQRNAGFFGARAERLVLRRAEPDTGTGAP